MTSSISASLRALAATIRADIGDVDPTAGWLSATIAREPLAQSTLLDRAADTLDELTDLVSVLWAEVTSEWVAIHGHDDPLALRVRAALKGQDTAGEP